MFYECENLKTINLFSFKTKKVINMEYMFYDCKSLINLDLSSLDVKNVNNMSFMFYECVNLKNINFFYLIRKILIIKNICFIIVNQ